MGQRDEHPKRRGEAAGGCVTCFALLAHLDKTTIDPLNVSQRRFYVFDECSRRSNTQPAFNHVEVAARAMRSARPFNGLLAAVEKAAGR